MSERKILEMSERNEDSTQFLHCQLQQVGKLPLLWSSSVQLTANAENSACLPRYPEAQTQREFSAKK